MSRRVVVVASELLGRVGTGGAGTADSLLAIALGRAGHEVELLVASGRGAQDVTPAWRKTYDDAGVTIRVLERTQHVRPRFLAPSYEVFAALRERPPDVVVADDWRGLAFVPLRARQTGIALTETAFVIHCHGPGRVLTEFAQKVPDTLDRFGESVAERHAVALADAVVSPSEWLLGWMREHRWTVPGDARVIQYPRQSLVVGDGAGATSRPAEAVKRIAFFGQLREGKGIRIFVSALGELEPQLLDGAEIVFLGSARGRWTEPTIAAAIPDEVKSRTSAIRFETQLERDDALAELERPGTLAVMPSLLDNSPNTVSECIERGIPFLAARTGGIPELVSADDRERVLFAPDTADLAEALSRALADGAFAPARPARDPHESPRAWAHLVETVEPLERPRDAPAAAVAIVPAGETAPRRAHELASSSRHVNVEVVGARSRAEGLSGASAEWVLFLDDEDEPDDGLVDTLVEAQAASRADAVTVAVRPADDPAGIHVFLGDPGAFGLVENHYGVVALVRTSLARGISLPTAHVDPDWPLLAQLALYGATIVSIPQPLATHAGRVGESTDVPGDGLRVLEAFEAAQAHVHDLPQLAATLGAAQLRRQAQDGAAPARTSLRARLRARLVRR